MKLKRLKLENFRGFEKIDIDFDGNLNVFIGKNGSGKSTILRSIAINLEHFIKSLNNSQNKDFNVNFFPTKEDIKIGHDKCEFEVVLEHDGEEYRQIGNINKQGFHNYSGSIHKLKKKFQNDLDAQLPVLLYIKPHRNYIDEGNEDNVEYLEKFVGYKNSILKQNFHFNDFAFWLKEQENIENSIRVKPGKIDERLPSLQNVRESIKLLFFALKEHIYRDLTIKRIESNEFKIVTESPSLEITKGEEPMSFNQLSDGEQTLLVIVADIARRSVLTSPKLGRLASGIVIIDEIEIHLHPIWQREVVPALQECFPNIQFIIATHSPQVLSKVKYNSIILLKDFKQFSIHSTFGKDTNSILAEMDLDEGPFSEQINKLYLLIKDKKVEEANKLQKDLESSIGSDYGYLIKSRLFLERMM